MYKVVPVFVFFENKEFRSDVTSTGTLLTGSNLWRDFGPFAKFTVYSASLAETRKLRRFPIASTSHASLSETLEMPPT